MHNALSGLGRNVSWGFKYDLVSRRVACVVFFSPFLLVVPLGFSISQKWVATLGIPLIVLSSCPPSLPPLLPSSTNLIRTATLLNAQSFAICTAKFSFFLFSSDKYLWLSDVSLAIRIHFPYEYVCGYVCMCEPVCVYTQSHFYILHYAWKYVLCMALLKPVSRNCAWRWKSTNALTVYPSWSFASFLVDLYINIEYGTFYVN